MSQSHQIFAKKTIKSLSSASVFPMLSPYIVNDLLKTVWEYSQPVTPEWVADVMHNNTDNISIRSKKIVNACLFALNEDSPSLVSQALNLLTEDEKNELYEYWNTVFISAHQKQEYLLLKLYFKPFFRWNNNDFKMIKMLSQNNRESLSKHLVPNILLRYFLNKNISQFHRLLHNAKAPLLHINLSEETFDAVDISSANFCGANFAGSTFRTAKLKNSIFNHANFNNSRISLSHADGSTFQYTSFLNAELIYSTFVGSDFSYSNLSNAYITAGEFKDAKMYAVNLSNIKGSCVDDFKRLRFINCCFRGAEISHTMELSDALVRQSIREIGNANPIFIPLIEYLNNWHKKHRVASFFFYGGDAPIDECRAVIHLCGAKNEYDLDARLRRDLNIFPSLENKHFNAALGKVRQNIFEARYFPGISVSDSLTLLEHTPAIYNNSP